jgi:glucosylceramidase
VNLGRGLVVLGALAAVTVVLAGCGHASRRVQDPSVEVVQTTQDLTYRLTRLPSLRFEASVPRRVPVIHVDDALEYQRVIGVGVVITDTAAWLLHDELSAATSADVMRNLFGTNGIHLGLVRVPMGATDFTKAERPYSYDDLSPGQSDPTLSRFSVAHDDAYIVPVLRQMLAVNPNVQVLASPWSPPGWMKTNGKLGNPGDSGALLPADYGPWAGYFVKFLRAYAARGIPVQSITAQNEPGQQSIYPGLDMTEPTEALLIARYLAPALRAAGLHTRIYGHDFKLLFYSRAHALISDPAVRHVLAGIAWHCYEGSMVSMTRLHVLAPELDQLESECATGGAPGPVGEMMIASFRNWASGAILWSVALDPHGGPVQPPNLGCSLCTPVVMVDERTHTVRYRLDYYELGQLSAFVKPGARRVASNNFVIYNSPHYRQRINYSTPGIDDVAFRNPDGSEVLLVRNNAAQSKRFAVLWRSRAFSYTLPGQGLVTFLWR